jgi:hypothetical protein
MVVVVGLHCTAGDWPGRTSKVHIRSRDRDLVYAAKLFVGKQGFFSLQIRNFQ